METVSECRYIVTALNSALFICCAARARSSFLGIKCNMTVIRRLAKSKIEGAIRLAHSQFCAATTQAVGIRV
jgi:hypothetical protein